MFYIAVTRFNNETWRENQRWREKHDYKGCIYNTPIHIKDSIPLEITLYIIEMNNQTNNIMGIGRLINKVYTDKKYKIYSENNYNRYTYKGNSYLSREEIISENGKNEKILIEAIEKFLFKGYKHMKRGQGITILPIDHQLRFARYIQDLFRNF